MNQGYKDTEIKGSVNQGYKDTDGFGDQCMRDTRILRDLGKHIYWDSGIQRESLKIAQYSVRRRSSTLNIRDKMSSSVEEIFKESI